MCRFTLTCSWPFGFLFEKSFFFFFAAGYNNLEVAEYLLEHGADVNAQDKGGLIPLHNAASYGVRFDICTFLKRFTELIVKRITERPESNIQYRFSKKKNRCVNCSILC